MQNPSRLKLSALLALAVAAAAPAALAQTVVYSGGDNVVVKTADGKLLNYSGTKSAAGLKPGAKFTAPASGTPQVVTGVSVAKAKVYNITPPNGLTLTLPEGIKDVVVADGTIFNVDGKQLTLAQLKTDQTIDVTVITTAATGASATSTPAQSGTLLVAKGAGDEDLPSAGTNLPLYGGLGVVFLSLGVAMVGFRKAEQL